MSKLKSQPAPRKKKNSRKAKKRAKDRSSLHPLSAPNTSPSETDTSKLSGSSMSVDEHNRQLEQNQVLHETGKQESEATRNEGKHHSAKIHSGDNTIKFCTCEKINGYCMHSKIKINGR